MIGENGIFHNKAYAISLQCETCTGKLWAIRRRDFFALKEYSEEEFKKIKIRSDEMEARMNKQYIQKLQHVLTLKSTNHKKDVDIKKMSKGIMRE